MRDVLCNLRRSPLRKLLDQARLLSLVLQHGAVCRQDEDDDALLAFLREATRSCIEEGRVLGEDCGSG